MYQRFAFYYDKSIKIVNFNLYNSNIFNTDNKIPDKIIFGAIKFLY